MNLFKRNGAAEVEAELNALERRRELLQGRLGAAVAAAQAASKAALANLVDGDVDDENTQRQLEDAARDAGRAADSLAAGLGELDARVDEARQRLTAARDAEVRERRANELEVAAAAISKRAAVLEKSVDALAAAFDLFVAELPEDFSIELERLFPSDQRTPKTGNATDAARAILAGAIYLSEPRLFEVCPLEESYAPAHSGRAMMLRHFDEKAGGKLDHRLWGVTGEEVDVASVRASTEKHIVSPLLAMAQALRSPTSDAT